MATRNLTPKFNALREVKEETGETSVSSSQFMDIVVDIHEKFNKNTADIKENANKISKIYNNSFFDSNDSEVKKEQELFQDITKKVKQNAKAIESLKKFQHDKIVKNIIIACTSQLKESQKLIKTLTKRRRDLTCDPDPDLGGAPQSPPSNADSMGLLGVMGDSPMEMVAQDRTKAITKLAQNIQELNQIFKDLNSLVIDQGTLLDRLDYNIEQAEKHINQGTQEVVKAENYQKNSSKMANAAIVGLVGTSVVLGTALGIKKS